MSKYILTVIIPVYNMGSSVGACLSSLFKEDIPEMQVVVIDDGSTDNTAAVLRSFEGHNGYVHMSTPNQGVSSARNRGISLAKGDYIWFIDADDQVDTTFISPTISILKQGTEDKTPWDLVAFGSLNMFASDAITAHAVATDLYLKNFQQFREKFDVIFSAIPYNVPWNKFFRREIIVRHQLSFPSMTTGEDAAFMTSYLPYVNSCYVSAKTPYLYQLESTTSMRSTHQALKEYQDNRNRIINQIEVFQKLGLTRSKVTSEAVYRLVFGTYILLYRDARDAHTGIKGFLDTVHMMPSLRDFIALANGIPITPHIRVIRFLANHPFVFYIYQHMRNM